MIKICINPVQEGYHKTTCGKECILYEVCEHSRPDLDFSPNISLLVMQQRIRDGKCPTCGCDLCEHRLR